MYGWPNPPIEVEDEDFVSQSDVAGELAVWTLSVGTLIAMGRLQPATLSGRAGVTRSSLAEEVQRRTRPLWRVRLVAQTLLHFFSF
jgi:hypothetical protein